MEPGINWRGETFRRNHGTELIAGWQLPTNWDADNYKGNLPKGVPREGHLIFDYTSDPARGCAADALTRAALSKQYFLVGVPRPAPAPDPTRPPTGELLEDGDFEEALRTRSQTGTG